VKERGNREGNWGGKDLPLVPGGETPSGKGKEHTFRERSARKEWDSDTGRIQVIVAVFEMRSRRNLDRI